MNALEFCITIILLLLGIFLLCWVFGVVIMALVKIAAGVVGLIFVLMALSTIFDI